MKTTSRVIPGFDFDTTDGIAKAHEHFQEASRLMSRMRDAYKEMVDSLESLYAEPTNVERRLRVANALYAVLREQRNAVSAMRLPNGPLN